MSEPIDTPEPPDARSVRVGSSVPQAIIRSAEQVASGRLRTRLWWLTGLCVLLAVGLVFTSFRSQGQPIAIRFEDGHGLKVGDTLRFRGIDVGAVTSIKLSEALDGVEVHIELEPGNEQIAVEGSQFWIQRARLRLGQISGLDTVLGAKYVGVIPGDASAAPQRSFVGIESPLAMTAGDSREIRVQFPAGEGLDVGDPVRFRGIAVGEVTFVELSEDVESVAVGVRLVGSARQFARAGTQFWIERPRLDLTEVRGLDTLLGGRYIALQPTTLQSPEQHEFTGLAEAPPLPRSDGSLEIELDAPRRLGLVRSAPITYRGLEVGRVANVGLSKDGASVKVTGVIETEYAELVRANSKWWAVGGVEVDASLAGVSVSVESLSAWIRGGIAFSTPPSPGARVVTGHRFMLEPEPQPEWLAWQPRIAIGGLGQSATGLEFPTPVRVVASWQASWLGLYRRRTAETWGLALADGTLHVPLSFIDTAAAAEDVTIEIAGASWSFAADQVKRSKHIGVLTLPKDVNVERWSVNDVSKLDKATTTMLVVNPELSEPLAIDQTRVTPEVGCLKIAPGVAISAPLGGSPAIDAATGKVIGLLIRTDNGWQICEL
ncbi:MAG: MlaD family protein [Pirellulaceae bacterium]